MLLYAGVVADWRILAPIAPGDVTNDRWLRVNTGGREAH